jgi:hypothetical protein
MKPLILHLKRVYWEAIRDGDKLEEYRLRTPYWEKRLQGREYSAVHLLLGYPARDDESRIIRRPWRGYESRNIWHPQFGPGIHRVFAISVAVDEL